MRSLQSSPILATRPRPGFTLVEMLVVIAVMLVLMTLAVAFVPRAREQQRVAQAAASVQGWLAIAKSWALRDQAPRGIRLTPGAGTSWVTTLQYIEQPDDWVGSPGSFISTAGPFGADQHYSITLNNSPTSDFWGGYTINDKLLWPVQPGDMVEIDSGYNAKLYMIPQRNVFPAIPEPIPSNNTILIPTKISPSIPAQGNYRIVRGPRIKEGEAPLQIQTDVAIDVSTNTNYGCPLPASVNSGSFDIIFAPSGAVISPGLTGGDLRLWLIDTSINPAPGAVYAGQQFVVSVSVRTGMISIKPVNVTLNAAGTGYASPYSYAQDGAADGTLSGF